MAGVIQCEVNLEEKSANVEFDPDILEAKTVVETINNIGTKVSLCENSSMLLFNFYNSLQLHCTMVKP